jgi:hypothetical protein
MSVCSLDNHRHSALGNENGLPPIFKVQNLSRLSRKEGIPGTIRSHIRGAKPPEKPNRSRNDEITRNRHTATPWTRIFESRMPPSHKEVLSTRTVHAIPRTRTFDPKPDLRMNHDRLRRVLVYTSSSPYVCNIENLELTPHQTLTTLENSFEHDSLS